MPPWNVLATSPEGRRDALLVALRRLGRFRPGGYRNVVVGAVDDPAAFPALVETALTTDPLLPTALARLVPIARTLRFDPADPVAQLGPALEPLLMAAAASSFFVRVERRGLKGRLHSPTVERALGEQTWRALAGHGATPRVDFRDPDVVVLVETLGDEAGIAILPRALRRAHPFTRVR